MTIVSNVSADFNKLLEYGEQIRFQYYNQFLTGEYDDDITLVQSGADYWCSGVVQPIDTTFGSHDSLLFEQGKILMDDKKIYLNGSVQTSGLGPIKIGMNGSPTTEQFRMIDDGKNTQWSANGVSIYKKVYVRYLTNGSFIGN